jgi:hypothetical protein
VAVEPADLGLDLVDDPVGGLALALEVGQLLADVVRLSLQPVALLLQPGALATHFFEPAAGIIEVGLGGDPRWRGGSA